MFDNPSPPTNLPTGAPEPEDIFAEVSSPKPQEAALQTPPAPPPSAPPPKVALKEPVISSRRAIIFLGALVAVVAIGGIAWGVLRFVRRAAAPPEPLSPQTAEETAPAESVVPPEIPSLPSPPPLETPEGLPTLTTPPPAEEAQLTDTDGDGLFDAEELSLGTQQSNPDSDNDGLLDGEEAKTYGTDPLDPDTDADSFLDGQEVRNGYNPNGEGRLFSVPSQ